jgi:hypothetical protein
MGQKCSITIRTFGKNTAIKNRAIFLPKICNNQSLVFANKFAKFAFKKSKTKIISVCGILDLYLIYGSSYSKSAILTAKLYFICVVITNYL